MFYESAQSASPRSVRVEDKVHWRRRRLEIRQKADEASRCNIISHLIRTRSDYSVSSQRSINGCRRIVDAEPRMDPHRSRARSLLGCRTERPKFGATFGVQPYAIVAMEIVRGHRRTCSGQIVW